jgi:hypothetical protein
MATERQRVGVSDLVKDLSLDDIRIDSAGRVVITSPSISDKIKAAGTLRPDDVARDDTNIICCGNGTCSKKGDLGKDLGTLVERFTHGGIK